MTLSHYEKNMDSGAVLFAGDLSYADHYPYHDNRRWDSWGRFVERSTAYQPWIWTVGNHELDFEPSIVSIEFLFFIFIFIIIYKKNM
jgi:acid phosphatase type 7